MTSFLTRNRLASRSAPEQSVGMLRGAPFRHDSFDLLKLPPEERAKMLNIVELDIVARHLCSLPRPERGIPSRFRSGIYAVFRIGDGDHLGKSIQQQTVEGRVITFRVPYEFEMQRGVVLFDAEHLIYDSDMCSVSVSSDFDPNLHAVRTYVRSNGPTLSVQINPTTGFAVDPDRHTQNPSTRSIFFLLGKEGHGFVTLLSNHTYLPVMELGTHMSLPAYVPQLLPESSP